jgi:hypothetical protein
LALGAAVAALLLTVPAAALASERPAEGDGSQAPAVPAFSHVVEVMLENESATATFENPAAEPALAKLRRSGLYIPKFYGVGHASLGNYEAAFAAVQPTAQGKADCLGEMYGSCIFPATVPTFAAPLDASRHTWKVYSEGMNGAPLGGDCLHPISRLAPDFYQGPLTNGYATRHNPAPWFDSVLTKGGSEEYCRAHSVDLTRLWTDSASPRTLPSWSFIEPDTCHDGHDTSSTGGCALDPEGPTAPSGTAAIDAWLPAFVRRLTTSPAWDARSLLVITFDEGASADTSGCTPCGDGSAGGRVGALLIGAPIAAPGTTATWAGDHYSLLRTWETGWGLPTLKSQAVSPAAAATVHDGDPGVLPLTGVWRAVDTTDSASAGAARSRAGRALHRARARYASHRRAAGRRRA